MLNYHSQKEHWLAVDGLIDRWLAERQDLIVRYCGVSGVHEFSPHSPTSVSRLRKFCQILLDYVSAGHFEVYEELLREAEHFADDSAASARALIARIEASTEAALEFNDRYADAGAEDRSQLSRHLSRLGEILAARFDLEDQLIARLHDAHREQAA